MRTTYMRLAVALMYLMSLVHLATAVPALASNITNADYYGTIT